MEKISRYDYLSISYPHICQKNIELLHKNSLRMGLPD